MKKFFTFLTALSLVLVFSGCTDTKDPGQDNPPVDNVDPVLPTITVTQYAKNILSEGEELPDFTTWFKITDSIDGSITITNDMIEHNIPVNENGIINQSGDYFVRVNFTNSIGTSGSREMSIIVNVNQSVQFEIEHYMNQELTWGFNGEDKFDLRFQTEDLVPILNIDVTGATDTDWHILFGIEGLEFTSAHVYNYTITAKTNVNGGRSIGVSFENSNHSRLTYDELILTNEYQTFTGSLLVTADSSGNKLNIFLGDITTAELGEVIFKEIRITESVGNIDVISNPGELQWTPTDLADMDTFIDNLIATMTIEEKVGQMLQGERSSVSVNDMTTYNLGSVLNGGGSIPGDNIEDWYSMYSLYQYGSSQSSSGIPMIFGTDSVHGNNNLLNSTIFPHNIGLGAANDPDLMRRIGEVTAVETRLTGISWTFAPAVSVAQDSRWGRTYESYSENPNVVAGLATPYIQGLQDFGVSATAKHFVADGGTSGGTDQGNAMLTEQEIRDIHLLPYYDAIAAGVDTIMISYSSINGSKMHGSEYWIQTVLKDEMGFEGFIISDYDAIHQLPGSHYDQVVASVNAGVDMLMEPHDWKSAYNDILNGYNNGDITLERINDAVRRILEVKYTRGLFSEDIFRYQPGLHASDDHLEVAREAVRKSLVLLQNNNNSLPLQKSENIYITGPGADDIGLLLGGWSVGWQGLTDPDSPFGAGFGQYKKDARVTTIVEGFTDALSLESGTLVNNINDADTVIVVFAEVPYAEYYGDDSNLHIINGRNAHPGNAAALQEARDAQAQGKNVVGILLSGRPLLINDILGDFDSFVAAWLPGSEGGNGIADVLLGDYDFTGTTQFVWYYDSSKFGTNSNSDDYDPNDYLFPYGFGLHYTD